MTGEVTDRFNEIALFGMACIFWQKAIEFFTKFIIRFLTYRVERLPYFLGFSNPAPVSAPARFSASPHKTSNFDNRPCSS